jgi:hypothetical protein
MRMSLQSQVDHSFEAGIFIKEAIICYRGTRSNAEGFKEKVRRNCPTNVNSF